MPIDLQLNYYAPLSFCWNEYVEYFKTLMIPSQQLCKLPNHQSVLCNVNYISLLRIYSNVVAFQSGIENFGKLLSLRTFFNNLLKCLIEMNGSEWLIDLIIIIINHTISKFQLDALLIYFWIIKCLKFIFDPSRYCIYF